MNSTWRTIYPCTIESDNLRLIVRRRYDDVKDQMSDDPRPEWEGSNTYKVEIVMLDVEYELIETPSGGFFKYRHEDVLRYASYTGDINFVDCIRMIAEKYDNYTTVTQVAEILTKDE